MLTTVICRLADQRTRWCYTRTAPVEQIASQTPDHCLRHVCPPDLNRKDDGGIRRQVPALACQHRCLSTGHVSGPSDQRSQLSRRTVHARPDTVQEALARRYHIGGGYDGPHHVVTSGGKRDARPARDG